MELYILHNIIQTRVVTVVSIIRVVIVLVYTQYGEVVHGEENNVQQTCGFDRTIDTNFFIYF